MELKKRRKGRPRKEEGRIEPWQFKRAGLAMSAYDNARGRGEKHSAAVKEAVNFVKALHPEMSISETEVRRILAAWRPKNAGTILRFEQSLAKRRIKKWRRILRQMAASQDSKCPRLPVPSKDCPPKSATIFRIRFAGRPNYPRSNRKAPRE
jgi:hypothetical protein